MSIDPTDIYLSEAWNGRFRVKPLTALGTYWLQVHFKKAHWPSMKTGRGFLKPADAMDMYVKAVKAGIHICASPEFTKNALHQQ